MFEILRPDGSLTAHAPADPAEARRLFAAMVSARTYDHKGTA